MIMAKWKRSNQQYFWDSYNYLFLAPKVESQIRRTANPVISSPSKFELLLLELKKKNIFCTLAMSVFPISWIYLICVIPGSVSAAKVIFFIVLLVKDRSKHDLITHPMTTLLKNTAFKSFCLFNCLWLTILFPTLNCHACIFKPS